MFLSPEIKKNIQNHAYEKRGSVVCGLIVDTGHNLLSYEITLFDAKFFLVSPVDLANASRLGKIVGIYRSNIDKFSQFSDLDIKTAKTLKCPIIVYDFSDFNVFEPEIEKDGLVKITLHGKLGESIGKTWRLAVNSVSEAVRAIEMNSKRKLFKFLYNNDKFGLKYRVLINGNDFLYSELPTIDKLNTITDSELACHIEDLKTIDIIPVMEGADKIGGIIGTVLGVILIVVGIILMVTPATAPLGLGIIMAGLGLVAAGVINLLSKPPNGGDFREIENAQGRTSYLFNGPENVTKEGGPVPLGYGRLLVGSQVISASYIVKNISADIGSDKKYDPGFFDTSVNYEINAVGSNRYKASYKGTSAKPSGWVSELVPIETSDITYQYVSNVFVSDSYIYLIVIILFKNGNVSSITGGATTEALTVKHRYLVRKSLSATITDKFEAVAYLSDCDINDLITRASAFTQSFATIDNPITALSVLETTVQTSILMAPARPLLPESKQYDITQAGNADSNYTRLSGKIYKILADKENNYFYYVGNFPKTASYTGLIAKAQINGNLFTTASFGASNLYDYSASACGIVDICKAGNDLIVSGYFYNGSNFFNIAVLDANGNVISTTAPTFVAIPGFAYPLIKSVYFDSASNYVYIAGDFVIDGTPQYKNAARLTFNTSTRALAVDTSWICPFNGALATNHDLAVDTINVVTQQISDKKLLFGGRFAILAKEGQEAAYSSYRGLLRTNEDGSYDNTFNAGIEKSKVGTENSINFVKVTEAAGSQYAGQIFIGGDFTEYNDSTNKNFAILTNGTYGRT